MPILRRRAVDQTGRAVELTAELTIGGPLRNVWADPPRYGWPGVGNTGPRQPMRPVAALSTSVNGEVIEAVDVAGGITVRADDVVIRHAQARRPVEAGAYVIRLYGANLLVEDFRTVGGSIAVYSTGGRYTLRRGEMTGCGDGPRIEQDDVSIEDCWVHHLQRTTGSHNDTIQIRRGDRTRITHNTLQAVRFDTGTFRFTDGRVGDPMNAVLQYGSDLVAGDSYDDLLFERNLCDGGNYTHNGPGSGDMRQTYRGNRYGRHFRYGLRTGVFGPDDVWAGNVWDHDGAPAPL